MLKLGKYSDGPAVRRCSPRNTSGTGAGVTKDDDYVIDVHAICEASHKRSRNETNQRIGRVDAHRTIADRLNSKNGAGGPEHDRKDNVSPASLSLMRRSEIKVHIQSPMLVPLLRENGCVYM